MAKFTWRNAITVRVGELSRTAQFEVFKLFRGMDEMAFPTLDAFYAEVETIIALHAPASLLHDGQLTNKGAFHIELEETEPVDIVLPLTRECFGSLPDSLAAAWIEAALAENARLDEALKKSVTRLIETVNAPASVSAPSTAPIPTT